jgi:heme/copper-type cytochrome/quinol oxidase subunit 4
VDAAALLLTACGGFLVAVLWMDLIFDVQVLGQRGRSELPDSVLASIATYYHRATTTSRPMSFLIALVMVVLLGALGFQAVRGDEAGWSIILSAIVSGVAVLLALLRTVPNAVRLGNRADATAEQTRLARAIFRDHVVCLGCIVAFLVVRIAVA